MTLIFCLDEMCGIAFGGRRQSRDRELCADILKSAEGKCLCMSEYSAGLFSDERIVISESPSSSEQELYFLELRDPTPYLELAKGVTVYRWNRHYPSDIVFRGELEELGFKLSESHDFKGFSHDKITKEIYIRV